MVKNNPLKDSFKKAAGYSDKGSTFIKPEEMSNGETYAITINPESQPDNALLNGFVDWWGEQQSYFNDLRGCKLTLYCETSQKGRLHWHGFIKVTKRVIFCMFSVPKLLKFTSTEIRKLGCVKDDESKNLFDDYADWLQYCLKIQPDMQEYIVSEFNPKISFKDNLKFDKSNSEKLIRT